MSPPNRLNKIVKAFQIKIDGQYFDYRNGQVLELTEIKNFFEGKGYQIIKFIPQERHVNAVLNRNLFLKLSTSKGISIVTENEATWNEAVSIFLSVPKNYERGYYINNYFYLITNYFNGKMFNNKIVKDNIDAIIDLSEKIMSLKIPLLPSDNYNFGKNHQEKFANKVESHFEAIPKEVKQKYSLEKLLILTKSGIPNLGAMPRHGDFAPWHMILSSNGEINLIDGEHAMSQGVEYYDIGYFIQRVFSVWKEKDLAKKIYERLISRGYEKNKLKTILLARAIGGFLDESLSPSPNYLIHEEFKDWVLS